MSTFSILFPNKPWLIKKQIRDDKFGLMWFNDQGDPKYNHYQAHFIFKPTNLEIDTYITSDKEGIDPNQKSFFGDIERKYNELLPQIILQIENKIKSFTNQEFKIQDFKKEFVMDAISMERNTFNIQDWYIRYTQRTGSIDGLYVKFKNWEIIEIK